MSRTATVTPKSSDGSALRDVLGRLASEVRTMLDHGVAAACARDVRRARVALARTAATDRLAVEADRRCLAMLSRGRHDPAVLRVIAADLKLVTTLARIEGLCVSLCKDVLQKAEAGPSPGELQPALSDMGARAIAMIDAAVAAYLTGDPALARLVLESQEVLEGDCSASFEELVGRLAQGALDVDDATRLHGLAEVVVRIGDHATALAELVLGSSEGHEPRRLAS